MKYGTELNSRCDLWAALTLEIAQRNSQLSTVSLKSFSHVAVSIPVPVS